MNRTLNHLLFTPVCELNLLFHCWACDSLLLYYSSTCLWQCRILCPMCNMIHFKRFPRVGQVHLTVITWVILLKQFNSLDKQTAMRTDVGNGCTIRPSNRSLKAIRCIFYVCNKFFVGNWYKVTYVIKILFQLDFKQFRFTALHFTMFAAASHYDKKTEIYKKRDIVIACIP